MGLRRPRQRLWSILLTASFSQTPVFMMVPPQSSRIKTTLDPCVVLMKDLISKYKHKWEDKGGIFSLAQGVVYWDPPPQCQKALQAAVCSTNSNLHLYGPDEGLPELRQRLLTKIRIENNLENHDVMITVGANQAYVNCVMTLLDEGSTSVVFAPYYFNHYMALQMTTNKILVGPTNHGVPDLDWLEQQLQSDPSIRLVTLVNPGNPTGILLDRSFVQRVVDLCKLHDCWLVLDATYEYFGDFDACFDDPHVIHIFSFSKSYALAGYRCGYLVVSNDAPRLYENLLKVQDTIPIAPSRISQIAALGALDAGRDWVKSQYATLDVSRQYIIEALQPLQDIIIGGSGAMYIMAKLPAAMEDEKVAEQLVDQYGVAVIPGSFCGFPGYIRVCYANLEPSTCKDAAERLRRGLTAIVKP